MLVLNFAENQTVPFDQMHFFFSITHLNDDEHVLGTCSHWTCPSAAKGQKAITHAYLNMHNTKWISSQQELLSFMRPCSFTGMLHFGIDGDSGPPADLQLLSEL